MGAKADSGSSSFASTPSKKLRASPVPKPQVEGDKLPTATSKHPLSLSNDPEMLINVEQEMHIMRQTILDQEAVFREQVSSFHLVYFLLRVPNNRCQLTGFFVCSFLVDATADGTLLARYDSVRSKSFISLVYLCADHVCCQPRQT